jgi:hypothetical protein
MLPTYCPACRYRKLVSGIHFGFHNRSSGGNGLPWSTGNGLPGCWQRLAGVCWQRVAVVSNNFQPFSIQHKWPIPTQQTSTDSTIAPLTHHMVALYLRHWPTMNWTRTACHAHQSVLQVLFCHLFYSPFRWTIKRPTKPLTQGWPVGGLSIARNFFIRSTISKSVRPVLRIPLSTFG